MDRREMLGALGIGAIGMTTLASTSRAADDVGHHHHDKVHEDCLKACAECAQACDEAFHHCYLQLKEGKTEHADSLHLVSDCAGFCALSACLIAKHSPLMAHSCQSCAEACRATAAECDKFDSEEMKSTVKLLRECEKTCREMVAAMKKGESH